MMIPRPEKKGPGKMSRGPTKFQHAASWIVLGLFLAFLAVLGLSALAFFRSDARAWGLGFGIFALAGLMAASWGWRGFFSGDHAAASVRQPSDEAAPMPAPTQASGNAGA